MAPAVFYLKSIAPPDMTIASMYRGVVPFIVAQLIVLLALAVWPPLGTYLPQIMFRF
jgi:TRAP-type mannitol/chloroaromatic compound transport system permease large subunit